MARHDSQCSNFLLRPPYLLVSVFTIVSYSVKAEVAPKKHDVSGNQPSCVDAECRTSARLSGLIGEGSWLMFSVLNMTEMWLKSRPDERVACDEYYVK